MNRFSLSVLFLCLFPVLVSAQVKEVPRTTFAAPWEFMGPTNVQGRVLSIAINPHNSSTIYAGSAGGGLWRSRTAGLGGDWQRINTGFPIASISAIAIDSTDSNTIYIGTGEVYRYHAAFGPSLDRTTQGSYGYGILKTTNGGATWTQLLPWSPSDQRGVEVIRLNPFNPKTILAGTTEGLYRSTDGGGSWTRPLDALMVQDIVFDHNDTTLVMATCGNFQSTGWGGYLSLDGGAGWFRMDNFPTFRGKARLESFAADPNVVFATVGSDTGMRGTIWKTTDFGATWDTLLSGRTYEAGWYGHFVVVHPEDAQSLILGSSLMYATSNGGATLLDASGSGVRNHNYVHDPADPNKVYVVGDNGVFVTNDFGYGYTNISTGMVTAQLQNGFSNSATSPNLALGQMVGTPGVTFTGSTTWTIGNGDEAGWTAISQVNDSLLYRNLSYGTFVVRSTDRGTSYNTFNFGGGGGGGVFTFYPSSWSSPMLASPSNPNILYVGHDRVSKSVDSSSSWTQTSGALDGNFAISMAMSAKSPDTVFVGMAPVNVPAHIFRTTNGGTSWQNVTGTLPNKFPLDLAVDPSNAVNVYAAFGGYGTGHLYKSTNTGSTWSDVSASLPDAPISAVVVDPLSSAMVYAGGDAGVYVSTDAGATWSAFNEALPEGCMVSDLTISPSNRKLRLATHGSGMFQHDLFSPTATTVDVALSGNWNLISLPLNPINTTPAAHFPTLLAGTLYSYDGQYLAATSLVPGKAYWAKFPVGTTTQQVSGPALSVVDVTLKKGWNLVGSIDHDVAAPSGGIIASSWYEFTPTGYAVAATLKPGHGYWLKASDAGSITIGTH